MGIENSDNRYELHKENLRRLNTLMGEAYNGMEMEDYFSYLSPEQGKMEVDTFEAKLNSPKVPLEDLIEKFKGHLGYLVA